MRTWFRWGRTDVTREGGDKSIDGDDAVTGLPARVTWRGVYLLVTLVFVLYVILLALLPRVVA